MASKKSFNNFFLLSLIIIYAFLINWFSGNRGVMPIDTFGFFDTGYSILKGKLPIRDYWIFTGLVVDYLQAFFFLIFGLSWKSYIFHSSFINILTTISFFYFLKNYNVNQFFAFLYCIAFATLCYPVSGTPFAYLHSYAFSLITIFIFLIAIKNKNNLAWFSLPFLFFVSFFSMQTPSFYIITLILIMGGYYFFKSKNFKNLNFFIGGSVLSFIIFFIFIFISNTPIKNLIYEYFLFPITIGEGRLASEATAYVKLSDQLNIKRIFGDFKFIHLFFIPLFLIHFFSSLKKNPEVFILNISVLASSSLFFFNQLNQANQIYIFSLIPVLASVLVINLKFLEKEKLNKFIYLILILVLIATIKFHYRYNVDRKFLDIEKLDKNLAVNALQIDEKLNHLKWISPNFKNPQDEIDLINLALTKIKSDKRKKVLVTHYQFLSLVLEEDLNILNRWYLWDNNTHPTENHKYFLFYKSFVNKNLAKNDIKVIYLLGANNEIPFNKLKNYFENKCFKDYIVVENKFSYHEIVNCKNKI